MNFDKNDMDLMIQNAIEEASVDGEVGMAAVTSVVLNRMKNSGKKPEEIILAPKQFSWTEEAHKLMRKPKDYGKAWKEAEKIVSDTIAQWDEDPMYASAGADHYATEEVIKNRDVSWLRDGKEYMFEPLGKIGSHLFFKSSNEQEDSASPYSLPNQLPPSEQTYITNPKKRVKK